MRMDAAGSYRKGPVFAAACLGMLGFGVMVTTVGAILPLLMQRYGLNGVGAGSLLTLLSFGILLGSLFFGPVVDRYGYRALLLACAVLVIVGLQGVALAPTLGWLRLSVLVVGFGGGVVNGGASALVSDISGERRSAGLSLLGIFFGLGAVGVPLVLGVLLDRFTYPALVAWLAVVLLPMVVLTATVRFPGAKRAGGLAPGDARRLLRDRVLILLGLVLLLQSGMEMTVGGWTVSFYQQQHGLTARGALFLLSLYWFGLMVARILLGTALRRVATRVALAGSLATALAGALLMTLSAQLIPAAAGTLLVGLGFGGVFPLVLALVGSRYADLSGTAFSLVLALALVGGMLLPLLTGALSEPLGLRVALAVVPVGLCTALGLLAAAARVKSMR